MPRLIINIKRVPISVCLRLFHRILAIHTIWLPDGSKLTKVTLTAPNMLEVQSKIERIKRIAKQIKNIELVVEFESERNNK